MAGPTATALKKVIRSVARADEAPVSDRDLLHRFAKEGDQATFAALVARHTGLVLGVCRRSLPILQDAEDAVQATFLILARKANGVRWQPSVANWLYITARRVARNAQRVAERRRKREARAAVPDVVQPLDRMSGRELLTALDEQLDKLPPRYREPLLLCYLEGLTRDEAAARLGLSAGTLKIRIHRGRMKLHDALTKGGCALGAGLLALAVTSRAGASPSRLVNAILSGPVPDGVAELARGVAVKGLFHKSLLAMTAIIGVVALGVGLTSIRSPAGQPPERSSTVVPEKARAKDVKPAEKTSKVVPVSGHVLDPDGKPVAGATFALIADESGAAVPKATSGEDGRFAFELPSPPEGRNPRQVVVSAPGFGIDWAVEPRADTVFRLAADQPITGRVVDLQGKPVAGATVAVRDVHAGPPGAFDELLKNWKKSAEEQEAAAGKLDRFIWNRGGLGQAFRTTTAKDGTFTLSGLGKDRVVTLLVTGTDVADTYAAVATRAGFDPAGAPLTPLQLYPAKCDLVVAPDKPVTGVVRDEKTKAPLAGVRVTGASLTTLRFGSYKFHAWPTPITTTDEGGKFTLRGLSKARAYVILADPEEGDEHLHRFGYVEDTVGSAPVTGDIDLPRGVVITGRVTNAETGTGAPSRVFSKPLEKNELLGEFSGYGPPDLPAPWHRGRDTQTDLSGRYKLTVMPGAGVVCVQAFSHKGTTVGFEKARATKKDIDDGIVDGKQGHFRTVGQGGYFNPEYMNAFKVITPAAKDGTMALDFTVRPEGDKE